MIQLGQTIGQEAPVTREHSIDAVIVVHVANGQPQLAGCGEGGEGQGEQCGTHRRTRHHLPPGWGLGNKRVLRRCSHAPYLGN